MISMKKLLQKITAEVNKLHPLVNSSDEFVEKKALIGQNPSPSSSFDEQTITSTSAGGISGKVLSDYDFIQIIFVRNASVNTIQLSYLLDNVINTEVDTNFIDYDTNTKWARGSIIRSNGIFFKNGYQSNTLSNTASLPYQIYGIKRIYGGGVN